MLRTRAGFWLVFLLIGNAGAAHAFEFRKIIETGVVTPGVNVNFGDLRYPALDGDTIAFCAQSFASFGKNGIYRADIGGGVAAIATDSTPGPSGGGNLRDMCVDAGQFPTIDDGQVAFPAYNNTTLGVYLHDGESLTTVVDENSTFPDTMANPLRFEAPSLNGRIAISWSNTPQNPVFAGIYSFDPHDPLSPFDPADLFAVADTNPQVPTTFFNVSDGTVGGGTYVWGVNQSPSGPSFVYRRRSNPLRPIELVASQGQEIANGHFVGSPGFPQADRSDGDQLCFVGGAPIAAVYRYDGSEVELVADKSTPIPDGTGTFTDFGLYCSMDAGEVVFQAAGANQQNGVYIARMNGALEKVIDTGDSLAGETPFQFQTGREAISNGRIAFVAYLGGEQSIWVTPESDSVAAGAIALFALAAMQRRRRR